jgi:hypothetical protein
MKVSQITRSYGIYLKLFVKVEICYAAIEVYSDSSITLHTKTYNQLRTSYCEAHILNAQNNKALHLKDLL